MAWFPGAKIRKIEHNFQKWLKRPLRGLVVHIDGGAYAPDKNGKKVLYRGSLPGVWSKFNDRTSMTSSHFAVSKQGELWQFLDTTDQSSFAIDGKYGGVDSYWLSVENIALPDEELTEDQLAVNGMLLGWLNQTERVPVKLATHAADSGLGYHSMFLSAAGAAMHPCPTGAVIRQLPRIVQIAQQTVDTGDFS